MNSELIDLKVRTFLVEELEIDEARIAPDSRLKEDMGIDSLEVVDIIVLIDKEFGVKMKPEDFKPLKTYGQFIQYLNNLLS